METSLEAKLRALVDRNEIRDVMYRYCRAVDRCDRELLESCYWPDARDNHGFFVGNAREFVDYVIPVLEQAQSTTHRLGNVLIELDGDRACSEAYCHVTHRLLRADGALVDNKANCRYLDLFERRNGEWRILFRTFVPDTMYDEVVTLHADPVAAAPMLGNLVPGQHGKGDPSYLGFDVVKLDRPDFQLRDFWKAVLPP